MCFHFQTSLCFSPLQEELQRWSQALGATVGPSGPPEAKAQTLPTPSTSSQAPPEPSSAKKDKKKPFSLFPKKK